MAWLPAGDLLVAQPRRRGIGGHGAPVDRRGHPGPQALAAILGATAAFQVLIVAVSGSVALLGCTVHNFADALTAVPLGVAFVVGRRRPNARCTYCYGRAEDLAGIFIVAVIALSAAVTAWESVQRLVHPEDVRNVGWMIVAGLIGFCRRGPSPPPPRHPPPDPGIHPHQPDLARRP